MKRLSGFSLMEMMIVLLIVSIVAAASAPMINKKMVTAASEKSPWVWTGTDNSIAYNLGGDNRTAVIGAVRPKDISNSRLYIETINAGTTYKPHITFANKNSNSDTFKFTAADNNIWLSTEDSNFSNVKDSVVIGRGAKSSNYRTVTIGSNVTSEDVNSVVIGSDAEIIGSTEESIAIGKSPKIRGPHGIAIGYSANANSSAVAIGANSIAYNSRSMALGYNTRARDFDSVAIGSGSNASGFGSIAIGTSSGNNYGAKGIGAVAIGPSSYASEAGALAMMGGKASGSESTSIGIFSKAAGANSIALGYQAKSNFTNSVALGANSTTDASNQIMLGSANHTVVVPGSLDLSQIEGTITLGSANATVHIPGKLIVGPSTDYSTPSRDDWIVHLRGVTYIGKKKIYPGSERAVGLYMPSVDGWGAINYKNNNNDNPVRITDSDRRLKNVGKAFVGGLKEIKQLETFHYTYKKDPTKTPRVGIMAQDLQKIFPDAVFKGEDGFLRIRMEDMFYALVNAVKELDAKIEAFRAQDISALKNKIDTLEKENKELKKQNQEFEKRLTKLEKNTK